MTHLSPNASAQSIALAKDGDTGRAHRARIALLVGTVVGVLLPAQRRDERGLSQSTENAILLAGAAAIALTIITVITAYVKSRLPK